MSWYAIAWAERAPVADVYERAIITLLAHRAKKDGSGAYPSVRTIAEYACCDERSVKRRLSALRNRGVIAYGDQAVAGYIDARYRPKVYDLMIPYSWFSADQIVDLNQERQERGLQPLQESDRPPLASPPRKKGRADAGVSRGKPTAEQPINTEDGSPPP